mmetsp:Transcript_26298/g.36652  ORF Transcript_26298/g.36652 Transcript_26298/m.36652 type:complete len:310 (+) Transcript_26298:298-1227(+)|eukprot:CAMPEP_0184481246 /NCGR_PEP_ID=MMETSP0113_2-20130426/2792_1 /TAXON_ID=91329 /ORGANISM="Norrisiella sphaerica, Strain BC52" /LENGTH=309 /DNA_ID=CAMNT_0026860249 /DNA_START=215 /DNA_END=1144 /DNA_ORIENTATION=+
MALNVKQFGLRIGEDGKMRLSMDPRAYKGPRCGDFVGDIFRRHHIELAKKESCYASRLASQMQASLSGTSPSIDKKEKETRKQKPGNSFNFSAPIIQLLDEVNPKDPRHESHASSPQLKQTYRGRRARTALDSSGLVLRSAARKEARSVGKLRFSHVNPPEISKKNPNAEALVKRSHSSYSTEELVEPLGLTKEILERIKQVRPHRAIVVQKISKESKLPPHMILRSILKRPSGSLNESNSQVLPSRRSTGGLMSRSHSAYTLTSSFSCSRRRIELHQKLLRPYQKSAPSSKLRASKSMQNFSHHLQDK